MKKIQTAEEFINKNSLVFLVKPELVMIEFAKLHVAAALEAASEKAFAHTDTNGEWVSSNVDSKVNKPSILNAYPVDNVK